jgi:coenzyme F420 hydrogenase subunit beta
MAFRDLASTILNHSLCASCGACESACEKDVISINPITLVPRYTGHDSQSSCEGCNDCVEACPGLDTGTKETELEMFGRTREADERWLGIYNNALFGYALDPEVYEASASGGCVTALALQAKEALDLDHVFIAGRNRAQGWRAETAAARSTDDFLKGAQSTYQLFAHLSKLKDYFRKTPDAKIGIVGVACHVQAIRKIQRMNTWLGRKARNQVKFVIEIACSSNTLPVGTSSLIDSQGVSHSSVSDVKYRSGEYPGDFHAALPSGRLVKVELWKAVMHFRSFKTHRCLSCPDWMSGLADISVCDGDSNIFLTSANPEMKGLKHGKMLVRTRLGQSIVDRAIGAGELKLAAEDVRSMNLGLERKKNRRRFYENSGKVIPLPPIENYVDEAAYVEDEVLLSRVASGKN